MLGTDFTVADKTTPSTPLSFYFLFFYNYKASKFINKLSSYIILDLIG